MKVYSSDINIDVHGSDQNRANPLLKLTGTSNRLTFVSITLFRHKVSTSDSYFIYLFVIESFVQEIWFKIADSSSDETSEVFMCESLNHTLNQLFQNLILKIGLLNILYFKYTHSLVSYPCRDSP